MKTQQPCAIPTVVFRSLKQQTQNIKKAIPQTFVSVLYINHPTQHNDTAPLQWPHQSEQ